MEKKLLLRAPSIGVAEYMWSVRDLNLGSMISSSTQITRFDQIQYKHN
jgi:hypothetical protein